MNSLVRVNNLCGLNEKLTKRNSGRSSQRENSREMVSNCLSSRGFALRMTVSLLLIVRQGFVSYRKSLGYVVRPSKFKVSLLFVAISV